MAQSYKLLNINQALLSGHLVDRPEIKYSPDGKAVLKFRMANSQPYKAKDSEEWQQKTVFIGVTSFGKLAERIADSNPEKGSGVYVEGKLRTNAWEKDGEKKSYIEIIASRITVLSKGSQEAPQEEVDEKDNSGE